MRLLVGVLLLFIIIFLVILLHRLGVKEGFTTENDFTQSQHNLFYDSFNKSVFTNTDNHDDLKTAAGAFATTDVFGNNANKAADVSAYFEDDPFPGLIQENRLCAAALDPSAMPQHEAGKKKGCGWWYVDDDTKQSTGALGTSEEAFGVVPLPGGGKWMWDLLAAQKMEDTKRCRKVKSCEVADLIPGRCGFCPGLNRGIPINSSKQSIYPEDPNLNCGSEVITNPSNCPRPQWQWDWRWNLRNENGEPITSPPTLICDPNPNTGKLSNACLLQLATGAGCTDGGVIVQILQGDSKITESIKFQTAIDYLFVQTNIKTRLSYYGNGVCSRSDALDYYSQVVKQSVTAADSQVRAAAAYLVNETTSYNECPTDPLAKGPFMLHCLQQVAREAKCQPAGTDYPTSETKEKYDFKNWSQILTYFGDLYESTKSNDFSEQGPAVKKCLGITVKSPNPDCGDTTGLSTYVYQWNYESNVLNGVPKSIYYGRMVSPTFPEFNNNGSYTPFNIGTDRIHMRIKANLKPDNTMKTRFWVMADDGISIQVDDTFVLQKWFDQGPTTYESSNIAISDGGKKRIVSDWYNNYGGYMVTYRLLLDGRFQPVPASMILQTQPTGYPIARWDFYEGYIDDRCGTLNSSVAGSIPIGNLGGRKCALFTGQNHIKIANAIKTTAFRSITMMVYIKSNPGPWPRLWEFNNNPSGFTGSWCDDSLFGCMSPSNSQGVGFYCKKACTGPELWSGETTMTTGKWTHIAWVLDEDLHGMTIYIDGVKKGRYQDSSFLLLGNKIYQNLYIFTSVEQFNKDAGVAWFRIFDYTMSAEDVQTDLSNGWSTKELFPKSPNTGF